MARRTLKKKLNKQIFAMCIPCHAEDVDSVDKCFKSIKDQEVAPDIITISVSSSTPEKEAIFNQKKKEYKLPIHYTFTKEALLPGANRNRAAANAIKLGATHLSFFDFDDIMHTKRLKIIKSAFTKNKALTGVVHNYEFIDTKANPNLSAQNLSAPSGPIKSRVYLNKLKFSKLNGNNFNTLYFDENFTKNIGNVNTPAVSNGHVSVKSNFWKRYPYREDIQFGEDQNFNANIIKKGTLGYINDSLALYIK
jgi:hypothetical protein